MYIHSRKFKCPWNKYHTTETRSDVRDEAPFLSSHTNLGGYLDALNITCYADPGLAQDIVPVCYGGSFAASVENIYNIDIKTWKKIEDTLARGDSIEEGHFMERSWAALLASPLEHFQIEALKNYSSWVSNDSSSVLRGVLVHE